MTRKLFCFLSITLSIAISSWAADTFYGAEFMSSQEAEKKWGDKAFDKSVFASGDFHRRAAMAVDLIKKNLFVGKPMKLVRQDLGNPDSYFFSDTIFAYKIMPFPGDRQTNWHLVFIPDDKLENVKEIKIHKKCCYKSPL